MKCHSVFQLLLNDYSTIPNNDHATAFAPTNIALIKYWGKRNVELNLPWTSSLSITLPNLGTTTSLSVIDQNEHSILLNGKKEELTSPFSKRLLDYLSLFKLPYTFLIQTHSNIPISAGLASSASGFAALVKALNKLFDWNLSLKTQSILARMGSGSAARSFWNGFVEWKKGKQEDGLDSHGVPLNYIFEDFYVGVILLDSTKKSVSSTAGMIRSELTSPFFKPWVNNTKKDLISIKKSLNEKNFEALGTITEMNSLAMHALMQTSWPPLFYSTPETLKKILEIQNLRSQGMQVYITQDAGPNIKILFQQKDKDLLQARYPDMIVCKPFKN